MQIKQNPFSLYDFLGYFIPGSMLLMSVSVWLLYENNLCSLLVTYCPSSTGGYQINTIESLSWLLPIGFIIVSYVLGFSLALASSLVVEHYLLLRKGYQSKYRFQPNPDTIFAKCSGWSIRDGLCIIFALPIVWVDMILGVIFGIDRSYYKAFHQEEVDAVKPVVQSILGKFNFDSDISLEQCKFNWHQYVYHYIYAQETPHAAKIQNYVALYGFSRTTSMVFVLLSWISPVAYYFEWAHYSATACLGHFLLFSSLSYVFFWGFAKFFRRYTDEILMAAVAFEAK